MVNIIFFTEYENFPFNFQLNSYLVDKIFIPFFLNMTWCTKWVIEMVRKREESSLG